MIYKRCSRCGKRILEGTKCQCSKERHKEYKKYRTDKKEERFYSSGEWLTIKDKVKDIYNDIDIYSYYVLNTVEVGQTVHHIDPIKDNWDRRLDIDNLIYLTESNHRKIHKAMLKDKEGTMRMLYTLIMQYKRDFKD